MIRLVIFDLDGTLLDTIADLGTAVNHSLQLHGYPQHPIDAYPAMVGHGVRNLVTQALPPEARCQEATVDSVLAGFREYYTRHIDVFTHPYEGMTELLEALTARGIALAVASNKFESGTRALIGRFFPHIPFALVCGNREGLPLKPDAALVRLILSQTGVAPEEAVMVGDSRTDIATAHNGGIRCIAVTWGFRPASVLTDALNSRSDVRADGDAGQQHDVRADGDALATSPAALASLLGL